MHRFHIDPLNAPEFKIGESVELPTHVSHQILNVLRLRPSEQIALFTGDGLEWTAELIRNHERERQKSPASARLLEINEPQVEMATKVSMVMALTRPQRYELALAKCTELGAHEFFPVITDRVLKSEATIGPNRMQRWQRIVTEASELSGRVRVPQIKEATALASALQTLNLEGAKVIVLWEEINSPMLSDLLMEMRRDLHAEEKVALVLGPVGGFAEAEAMATVEQNAKLASLGTRILRTETAAIASMALASQILR